MIFYGIGRAFSLEGEAQYATIGSFWDEMAAKWGLENLLGLGYGWQDGVILYAIGLKEGKIPEHNVRVELPDVGWTEALGLTDALPMLYEQIYRDGALTYELEQFFEDGSCRVRYYRANIH